MDEWRIYSSVALPFVSLVLKWLAVAIRRGAGTGKIRGRRVPPFPLGRQFRFIGWDLASASMGVYVAALVMPSSALRRSIEQVGALGNLAWIGSFIIYLLILLVCALVRYATQEVMERLGSGHWRWAFVTWLIGAYLFALAGRWAVAAVNR
jgi:hypothetical protein